MIGKVFIKDLIIETKVGHLIHERHNPQKIRINVAAWSDISASIKSEDLADCVDYCVIRETVHNMCAAREFVLIETLANSILDVCFEDPKVTKAWIMLEKPNKFPDCASVGIEIERTR
jgi:dihydroneopterin aldolase